MTVSISNIISDESSDCLASTACPGLSIPSSYNSSLTVKPFDQCKACSKCFNPHACWQDISIIPEHMHDYLYDQITKDNNIREKERALQALIGIMDRVNASIQDITEWAPNPISNVNYVGDLVGVTDYGLTVKRTATSADPNNITWTVTTNNPDYGQQNQPKYLNTQYSSALDAKSMLFFGANSYMKFHNGIITQRYDIDKNLPINGTYTIYTDTPVPSMAMNYLPNQDTGQPIKVYVRQYVGPFRETWINIRDYYYTWYGLKTLIIPVPTHQVYTIWSAGRIILPQYGQDYFTAQSTTDNINWSDVTFSSSQLYVEKNGGSYRTRLDLTSFDITNIAYIKLQFWGEDTNGNYPFYDRCKNSVMEPTGSYGKWSPDSRKFMCSKSKDVLNHSGGQTIIDDYTYDCCQSKCPYYEPDQCTSITDQNIWKQLIYSHPFKITINNAIASISRIGVASLASLSGLDLQTFNILDTEQHYDWFKGWMPKSCVWADENGVSQLHRVGGFESRCSRDDGTGMDFTSLPPAGPGGNNIGGRVQDYGYSSVNTSNDPYKILSNQVVLSSADIDRYTLAFKSSLGQFQRFRSGYQSWFPKIASGNNIQTYNDGTYQKFFADKDFNVQQAKDANTVYFGCIKAKSLRYAREYNDVNFGNTITASVWSSTTSGSNITVNLNNQTTSMTIQTGPQITREATIRCAGNLVALPDFMRIRNYSSNQNSVGPGRQYIQVGMVAEVSGIKGKFYVVGVKPAAGDKVPFDPNATTYNSGTDNTYYNNTVDNALGLPQNDHIDWGNNADQVVLLNEAGRIVSLTKGQTIIFSWTGVFMPSTVQVYQSDPNDTANDTTVACDVFSGAGECWIKSETDFTGKCLYITSTIADRSCIPSYQEFNSMLLAYEKLLSE